MIFKMGMYTIQDYIIYILLLFAIISIFLKFFDRVKLNGKFLLLISPYILVGILIRLLADTGTIPFDQRYSVTPGVYIVTILMGMTFLAIGFLARKIAGVDYWIIPFVSGSAISVFLLYELSPDIINPGWILIPVSLAVFITLSIYCLSILFGVNIFKKTENLGIIFAHLLDGSSTFFAYNYFNFYEEHLLPSSLISLAGDNAIILVPLKVVVILITLYFIEKWYAEEEKTVKSRNIYILIKLVIFVIGIGPGVRNTMLPALSL